MTRALLPVSIPSEAAIQDEPLQISGTILGCQIADSRHRLVVFRFIRYPPV
jgi:hypothetical protein